MDETDVPNEYSELFKIKDWITRDKVLKKENHYLRNDEIEDIFK